MDLRSGSHHVRRIQSCTPVAQLRPVGPNCHHRGTVIQRQGGLLAESTDSHEWKQQWHHLIENRTELIERSVQIVHLQAGREIILKNKENAASQLFLPGPGSHADQAGDPLPEAYEPVQRSALHQQDIQPPLGLPRKHRIQEN